MTSEIAKQVRGNSETWDKAVEILPESKIPVERMVTGTNGRIWLQLNYRGPTQKWLIINREGVPQKIVHLPKEGMITHVSGYHIGVRLNSYTFAIYEGVK